MARVEGFLKHPAIELQPGKLAIDEPLRTGEQILQRGFRCNRINPQFTRARTLDNIHFALQRFGSGLTIYSTTKKEL